MFKSKFLTFVTLLVIIVVGFLSFVFIKGFFLKEEVSDINTQKIEDVSFVKSYLENNYEGEFPYPKGDVLLLDENLNKIHLEDKNRSFDEIEDLHVLQGTTCGLGIKDEEFNQRNFDEEFSTGANKKCFSYAVTSDKEKFQIGAVLQAEEDLSTRYAYLTGNASSSIMKGYQGEKDVLQEKKVLPYMPVKNYKMKLSLEKGDPEIDIKQGGNSLEITGNLKEKMKNEGINLPTDRKVSNMKIESEGNDFLLKVVYPNGNVQLLSPNENNKAKVRIENFQYDGVNTNVDLFNSLGKVAYNMVSVGDASKYDIYDSQGNTLVIRGTKFTLDMIDDWTSSYLVEGKMDYRKGGDSYIVDEEKNVIGFKDGENVDMFDFPEKLKGMYSYGIYMDSYLKPESSFKISEEEKSLTGKAYELFVEANGGKIEQDKVYNLKEDNGKEFYLLKLNGFFSFDNQGKKRGEFYEQNFEYFKKVYKQRTGDEDISDDRLKQLVEENSHRNYFFYQNYDNICKQNGYDGYIKIKDAYKFLSEKEYSADEIKFELNNDVERVLSDEYAMVFGNVVDENLGTTYFDTKNGFVNYKSNPNTENESQKRDGVVLLCK